jgi:hypothetical protein
MIPALAVLISMEATGSNPACATISYRSAARCAWGFSLPGVEKHRERYTRRDVEVVSQQPARFAEAGVKMNAKFT